ncbi:MAG: OsmC family protein [Acidobacteria bacterium]|nr:OsmC family protein [Acidobacteriota bacterium]
MEILVTFPGGWRVDARFGPHTIASDQPVDRGGEDTAPPPFEAFLASIGNCAGGYVLGFCRKRGIPAEDIQIVQKVSLDPETGMVTDLVLEIQVPASFPERYHGALVRAVDQCKVKKHLENPFPMSATTSVRQG